MHWIEISVQADAEAAEAVSELFNRLNSRPDGQGGAVTEVTGFDPVGDEHRLSVTVRTYLQAGAPETDARQRQLQEGLWYLGRIYPLGVPQIRPLAEEDWANVWKSSYHPLRIGRRFLVIPAWQADAVSPGPGELPVVLDPGMAFGTGLHPSTQLCLQAMEDVVEPGHSVLDAGCGSGILSIAAVRLGAASVDAFDIDPIAVRATEENAALNTLPVAIRAFVSSGPGGWDGGLLPLSRGWDVILVNILPHVILELLGAGLHNYRAPRGRMILAGIIEEREPELLEALDVRGLRVVDRLAHGDWVGLVVE